MIPSSTPPFMGPPPSFTTRRRRPGCGCGCLARLIARLFIFALVVGGMSMGFDYLNAPWAYNWFDNPSLTGDWAAKLTTPDKRSGMLRLTLTHPLPKLSRHGGHGTNPSLREIGGTASLDFSPNGPKESYTIWGYMDRDGHTAHLQFQNSHLTQGGNYLSELKGKWAGKTLTLTGPWIPVTIEPGRGPVWHNGPTPVQAKITLSKSSPGG